MKRILVTGGASFLGSHLCEELLARGHEVLCLDTPSRTEKRNIAHILGNPRFHDVREDTSSNLDVEVDEIYHLACPASHLCEDRQPQCIQTCARGVVRTAQLFNAYGPRMVPRDGHLLSRLIDQALADCPLTVPGRGAHTCSLCFVEDLVNGLIALMESPLEITAPVNLADPISISVEELAQRVIRQCGSRSRIHRDASAEPDPLEAPPDITLARTTLGWEPKVPLELGLQRTIDYFAWTRAHS